MISPRTSTIALSLGVVLLALLACEDEAPRQFDDEQRRQAIEAEHQSIEDQARRRAAEIGEPIEQARQTINNAADGALEAAEIESEP